MRQSIQEWTSEFCGRQPYPFTFFKGCDRENLPSSLLNTFY